MGIPTVTTRICGDLRRVVDSLDDEGVPNETLTWRNVATSHAHGSEPFSSEDPMPYTDGFTYTYRIEDEYSSFDNSLFDPLPRTLEAWFFVLLVRDTQAPFDNMRTVRLDVDKLRRLGDEITIDRDASEQGQHSSLTFPPLIDCPSFAVSVLHSRFDAITLVENEPCAVMRFSMEPCTFVTTMNEGTMHGGSSFSGRMNLRLSDGAHMGGHFEEYVFFRDGVNHKPVYDMWRITEAQYENGSSSERA
jgi:hypothetical protein